MPFTQGPFWRQTMLRLKCLDLRSLLKLMACLQKSWVRLILLVDSISANDPAAYILALAWFFFLTRCTIFLYAVVRQEGLQWHIIKARGSVQEEFWGIRELQDWNRQQLDWGDPCSRSYLLNRNMWLMEQRQMDGNNKCEPLLPWAEFV